MNLVQIISRLGRLGLVTFCVAACSGQPRIEWIEGEPDDKGSAVHTIVVKDAAALKGDWTIWVSQFPSGVRTLEGSDADYSEIQANVHKITPLTSGAKDLTIRYRSSRLKRWSWAPEGFTLQQGDKLTKLKTEYKFLPLTQKDLDTEKCTVEATKPQGFAMLPTPKKRRCPYEVKPIGWYRIKVDKDITIESNEADGNFYAKQTLERLKDYYGERLPKMTVEDWPEYAYRGFMLDVSRNFTKTQDVKKLIDLLSGYKMNYLHLHLADDEGWRLEIPAIPELTAIGAHHSIFGDKGLQPSYDGNVFPDDTQALSNGYYTEDEFIDILRYAWERRIRIIPEFDTPGHSRAAIKSLAAYEQRTGDSSMRLQDPADDSIYYSAQGYTDNVMNVENESVYKFIELIFDEVIALYDKADVPLVAIHIGGDEVPHGAWHGKDLHTEYLSRVADIAIGKGVKIAGWQEVAQCRDSKVADKLKSVMFANYVWNTTGGNEDLPYRLAAQGYPTVVSDVYYTYADMAYNSSKREPAHDWACFIPESKSFNIPLRLERNVLGVQVQMFTETIRSFDDLCYDILPKMAGIFERAWNVDTRESESDFYGKVVYNEMPRWQKAGLNYRNPQL